jgi:hypothetical protein
MSVKAEPCTRRPGVRRVYTADALVGAPPGLRWSARLGAERCSIKLPINIVIAVINTWICTSDMQ